MLQAMGLQRVSHNLATESMVHGIFLARILEWAAISFSMCQPRGVEWGGRWGGRFKREETYVYLWLTHVEVWQKTTKFCKVIILQLKKKIPLLGELTL